MDSGFTPPHSFSPPNTDHVHNGRVQKPGSISGNTPASQHSHNSHDSGTGVNRTMSANSGPSNGVSNPRSCVTCRKRKVKCDKKHPCSNCQRAHIDCVFPAPGRAPRKARKPPDAELLERLRKLEGVVKGLGKQVQEEVQGKEKPREQADEILVSEPNMEWAEPAAPDYSQPPTTIPMDANTAIEQVLATNDEPYPCGPNMNLDSMPQGSTLMAQTKVPNQTAGLESRFGRLVVDEGRSRYVNNSHWSNLEAEVEDIKGILYDDFDEEWEAYEEPETPEENHQGFLFGLSSTNVDMRSLHPDPELFGVYWSMFKENIDPLIKILHIPTIEPKLFQAKNDLDNLPRGMEALMFAIYYSVTISMVPADCENYLQEPKKLLNDRYRFGVEQALARAGFLTSDEIIVLQAFVIFLICLRRNEEARVIWTLTGLVVQTAQTLGIHRDGTHFNLPPFEAEMRRRLWWQICILDSRASEDQGCDPIVTETMHDSKLPVNVNDTELDPNMQELPPSVIGCTEITFCLIRYEITNIVRRLAFIPPVSTPCTRHIEEATLEQKEQWIRQCQEHLEQQYLNNCDMSVPLYWVTATVSRLIMSKMWLLVYHPFQRLDGGKSLPQETRDRLFITSLENIEYSILLETETRTMKWGWLFRTYVQWHATAFLLSELCQRTRGRLVDRAWRAVQAQFMLKTQDNNTTDNRRNKKQMSLWKPLRKLYITARKAREKDVGVLFGESKMATTSIKSSSTGSTAGSSDSGTNPPYPQRLTSTLPNTMRTSYQPPNDGADAIINSLIPFRQDVLMPNGNKLGQTPPNPNPRDPQAALGTDLPPQDFNLDWLVLDSQLHQSPITGTQLTDMMGEDPNKGGSTMPNMGGSPSFGDVPMSHEQRSGSVGSQSQGSGDEELNWANFDDMVREYGMDMDPRLGDDGGAPRPGGFGLQTWF